jgi:hypothetical protein
MVLIWSSLGRLLPEIEKRLLQQQRTPVNVNLPRNPFAAELYTVAQALDPPVKEDGPTDPPDLIRYAAIASDVLNVVDPFTSKYGLLAVSQPDTGHSLAPGMVAELDGRLQMIRAVAGTRVLLFQATPDTWISPDRLTAVYDLSSMAMPPSDGSIPFPGGGTSGVNLNPVPATNGRPGNVVSAPGGSGPSTIVVGNSGRAIPETASVILPAEYKLAASRLSQGAGESTQRRVLQEERFLLYRINVAFWVNTRKIQIAIPEAC